MELKTKLIIGLSVAAVLGYGLFLWQIRKSGEDREALRIHKKERKEIEATVRQLEKQLKESQEKELAAEAFLLDALAEVSHRIAREQIYIDKIKVDSTILKDLEKEDAKNDSLSKYFTVDDWDRYIANQVGENRN